jgi:hypothetical protein
MMPSEVAAEGGNLWPGTLPQRAAEFLDSTEQDKAEWHAKERHHRNEAEEIEGGGRRCR